MARGYRLTDSARNDIVAILTRTHEQFGETARRRYEALIVTALRDVATDPVRPGTRAISELGEGVRCWHLRGSRERARTPEGTVGRPRHLIIYRPEAENRIAIGRILHDAMDLERHRPSDQDWR